MIKILPAPPMALSRVMVMAASTMLASVLSAQSQYPALKRVNFAQSSPQGFGDRQNSWAWSMAWFNGKLFVGTARALACVEDETYKLVVPSFPYPPPDPDVSCAPDPTNLPLQGEIWSWDPSTNQWTRVYQSPNNVPIPNTSPQKYTSEDQAFRGMGLFTESDGTQALYVSGCTSNIYGVNTGANILRTTDGVNFAPVPRNPGTALGKLKSACFRGIQSYNNKLYFISVQPSAVLEAADPKLGDNAFRVVTPSGVIPWELDIFNGYLYVSFTDNTNGFTVSKTTAQGTPPYTFTPIIKNGGYKSPDPNKAVLSMQEFNGHLYLGGDGLRSGAAFNAQAAELFRVNPDDTWDLVVGQSRNTPDGQKNALSNLGPGFGWGLNAHMWRMAVYDGRLYVGTFDESTVLRNVPKIGIQLTPELGFDLWYSSDGVSFSAIDYQGFEDKFNMGARTLVATPHGLFLGTANWWYGLQVWQGKPPGVN